MYIQYLSLSLIDLTCYAMLRYATRAGQNSLRLDININYKPLFESHAARGGELVVCHSISMYRKVPFIQEQLHHLK